MTPSQWDEVNRGTTQLANKQTCLPLNVLNADTHPVISYGKLGYKKFGS